MAENLNFETREGESRCYDNDSLNCKKYGRLYTWAALMDTLTTGYGYYKVGSTSRGALLADASEWDVTSGSWGRFRDLRKYVYFWTQTEYAREGQREKGLYGLYRGINSAVVH